MTGKRDSSPSTPWDVEAERVQQERNILLGDARDRVAYDWLKNGDVRPLAAWLLNGYEPGYLVRRALGWMLLAEHNAENLPKRIDDLPFQLVAKSRHCKGRPPDRAKKTRDQLLADNVHKLMSEMSYDAAIETVFEEIRKTAGRIGRQTIRDAYDQRYGKKGRP